MEGRRERMVAGRPVPREFVYCIFEGARCGTVQYYTRKVGTVRTSGSATALRLALEKPAMAAGTKLPYASTGALTQLLPEVVSRKVYCRVSAS